MLCSRHEMLHFVSSCEGYLANQILNVTWAEFQQKLATNVSRLQRATPASNFLGDRCLGRCTASSKLLGRPSNTLAKLAGNLSIVRCPLQPQTS